MEVNKIEKKYRLSKHDLVKYQIITELIFFKKENLIPSDIELLTLLGTWGPMELSKFCNAAAKKLHPNIEPEEFSTRAQNVRNRMSKLEKRGIISKSLDKKTILIAGVVIQSKGNVLLDYKFLTVESN
jgi:hypothetical protein